MSAGGDDSRRRARKSVSPNATRVSRQQRRQEERKGVRRDDASGSGSWAWIVALAVSLVSVGASLIARFNDARAFAAIDTPSLYCWLGLSLLCTGGVVLVVRARRRGIRVPTYFQLALGAGVACGLLSIWLVALPVLNKNDADDSVPIPGQRLDLRNMTIQDQSFAGSNLRGSDLSGATLRHVDLSETDLSESDLRNARLEDVDLSGANLCGADIRGADLRLARGLDAVDDWSYVFYSTHSTPSTRITLLPINQGYFLEALPGPIPDTGRDLLYMCEADKTRRIVGGS